METMATLAWVVNHIRKYGVSSKKFLIFVNYVLSTADVYDYLEKGLGDLAFANRVASTNNTIVEMYCSATDPRDQKRILDRFKQVDGSLRIVVVTIAFGMGIDIPDVDMVIHWGLPRSPLQYMQQMGRAGRNQRFSMSILYVLKASVRACTNEEMKTIAECSSSRCLRECLLKTFCLNDIMTEQLKGLTGRSVCSENCTSISDQCFLCKLHMLQFMQTKMPQWNRADDGPVPEVD